MTGMLSQTELESLVAAGDIDTVIVALPPAAEHQLVETLNKLNVVPVDVRLCPSEFALRLGAVQASHIGVGGGGWDATGWAVMTAWTVGLSVIAAHVYRRDTERS